MLACWRGPPVATDCQTLDPGSLRVSGPPFRVRGCAFQVRRSAPAECVSARTRARFGTRAGAFQVRPVRDVSN